MMQRRPILFGIAATVVAVLALLGSFRWSVPLDRVQPGLETALHRDTGYRISAIGDVAFTAFPWPVIQISGLELQKPGSTETASVPLLKARLNLFAWLVGNPQITALALFEPKVRLESLDNEPEAAATLVGAFLRTDPRPSLNQLRVQSAEVIVAGVPVVRDLSITISNIAANDLRLAGTGHYRGMPLQFSANMAPTPAGTRRPLLWRLAISDAQVAFDGFLMSPPSLDADGQLTMTLGAAALRSRPLSMPRDMALMLDGLSLRGEGRLTFPQLQLREVTLQRNDLKLQGGLEMTLSMTAPRVTATLHTDRINANPALAAVLELIDNDPLPVSGLHSGVLAAATADLRLSAGQVSMSGVSLTGAALSAKLAGGRMEFGLIEGRMGAGQLKGRVSLGLSQGGAETRGPETRVLEARGHLSGEGINLATFLGGAPQRLSGVASGHFGFEATGRGWTDLAQAARGQGHLNIRDGDFSGVDVERFLRMTDMGLPEGRARFRQVTGRLALGEGELQLVDGRVAATLWSGDLHGSVNLPQRTLDLLARLRLGASPPGGPQLPERTLHWQGPWSAPVLSPGTGQSFRRSDSPRADKKTDIAG